MVTGLVHVRQSDQESCGFAALLMLLSKVISISEITFDEMAKIAGVDKLWLTKYGLSPYHMALIVEKLCPGYILWMKEETCVADMCVLAGMDIPFGIEWQGLLYPVGVYGMPMASNFDDGHCSVGVDVDLRTGELFYYDVHRLSADEPERIPLAIWFERARDSNVIPHWNDPDKLGEVVDTRLVFFIALRGATFPQHMNFCPAIQYLWKEGKPPKE